MKRHLETWYEELHLVYITEEETILQLRAQQMAKIKDNKILLESFEQQRRRLEDSTRELIGHINNTDFCNPDQNVSQLQSAAKSPTR